MAGAERLYHILEGGREMKKVGNHWGRWTGLFGGTEFISHDVLLKTTNAGAQK